MHDRPTPTDRPTAEIDLGELRRLLDSTRFASIDELVARHGGPALASASRRATPTGPPASAVESVARASERLDPSGAPPLPRRR